MSFVTAALLALGGAYSNQSPSLSAEQWTKDLGILRSSLTQLHPGLLRYQSLKDFDRDFKALEKQLSKETSRREGYLEIAKFLAKIQCGHTYLNPLNQTDEVKLELFSGRDKLPFAFKWVKGQMIVTTGLVEQRGLLRGSRIHSINGVSTKKILSELMKVARADGSNDGKRESLLSVSPGGALQAFDIYYPLVFPVTSSQFDLKLDLPSGKRGVSLSVPALTYEERISPASGASLQPEDFLRYAVIGNRTAIVSMPTWAVFNVKWDWKKVIDDFFDDIIVKGATSLVIDIRDNEGGLNVGAKIISRIADRSIPQNQFETYVKYRKTPEDLNPYLTTWDDGYKDFTKFIKEQPDGRLKLVRPFDEDTLSIRPTGKRFKGDVYVLMGAGNSSATFHFLTLLKANRLATLVGQESGGNQRGINGGGVLFLKLPESKLSVDIPVIGYLPTDAKPDKGVEPDVLVKLSAEAIAKGEDRELARALSIIAST